MRLIEPTVEDLEISKARPNIATLLNAASNFRFKLKRFRLTFYEEPPISTEGEKDCLLKFLESQAAHISSLHLGNFFSTEILRLVFKLPNLIDLEVDYTNEGIDIDWETLRLNPCSTLTSFHTFGPDSDPLDMFSDSEIRVYDSLLKAMPNLKDFVFVSLFEDTILEVIALRCPKIEKLNGRDIHHQ